RRQSDPPCWSWHRRHSDDDTVSRRSGGPVRGDGRLPGGTGGGQQYSLADQEIIMKAGIAGYGRSPVHFARKGALAEVRPDDLAAQVVKGLLARTDLDPSLLEDVIRGCAYPEAAQGNNMARSVGLLSGLPREVGGMTINRFCGSSMSAIHIAAAQIEAGIG